MIVSGLTSGGDWRFGKGRANYLRRADAIRQGVVTRLQSFTNDWFLDTSAGLPWIEMMGQRDNRRELRREIERVVLTSYGVRTIERLEITAVDANRSATIYLTCRDIYDQTFTETVSVTP